MVSTTEEVIAPVEVQQPAEIRSITEEEFEKAQKLFQQGKKNLFLNKYDESVNNFADACKTYAAKYGEMDPQCADVYFFYGRALLELARIENNVLGNALTGVPEETGEPINDSRYGNPEDVAAEEKEEIAEKVIDAMCATEEELRADEQQASGESAPAAANDEPATTTTTEETAPAAATTTEATAEPVASTSEEAAAAEGEEEGDEEGDDEEDEETGEEKEGEEDIGNLQSSWEMFELAKVIYTKNFESDQLFKFKRIAECLLKLGEISIEQEAYEQAVTDITESIRVQEEQIQAADRDERMLAESYYQLGLSRQFNNQFVEANEAYQRSINIVQLRIEKLRGRLLGITAEGADADLERTSVNDEIAELEALLPEMQSKLEEVAEQGQQTLNLIKEAKECFSSSMNTSAGAAAATNGEVKDITSMVKSKRKIEGDENGSMKKTRLSGEGCEGEVVAEENKENQVTEEPVRMEESSGKEAAVEAAQEPAAPVAEQPAATA